MQPSRNISAAPDWQCVYDFAGYWSGFGFRDQTSLSVDWSPSLGVARFSGLTGFCGDESAIDGLRIAYTRDGERDLSALMQAAFRSWLTDAQADCADQSSEESFSENRRGKRLAFP